MFKRTIGDLTTFTIMFAVMLLMFTMLSINLGVDESSTSTESGDYPNVNGFIQHFLVATRNSVGDIQVPGYSNWSKVS